MTLSARIRKNANDSLQSIIVKRDASLAEQNYGLRTYNTDIEFYFASSGNRYRYAATGSNMQLYTRYHVV